MSLVVATQNVAYIGNPSDTDYPEREWDVRLPILADRVRLSGAGIIGIQESRVVVPGITQARQLAQTLGAHWRSADVPFIELGIVWRADRFVLRSAVSSFPMNEVIKKNDKYPNRPERACTWGLFQDRRTGKRFIFASLHGPNQDDVPDGHTFTDMSAEAGDIVGKRMRDLVEQYKCPAVIVGDWNSLGTMQSWVATKGFIDTTTISGLPVGGAPLNSINQWDATMTDKQNSQWVDRVMVSANIVVEDVGLVFKFAAGKALPLRTPLPSDHLMMSARLALP